MRVQVRKTASYDRARATEGSPAPADGEADRARRDGSRARGDGDDVSSAGRRGGGNRLRDGRVPDRSMSRAAKDAEARAPRKGLRAVRGAAHDFGGVYGGAGVPASARGRDDGEEAQDRGGRRDEALGDEGGGVAHRREPRPVPRVQRGALPSHHRDRRRESRPRRAVETGGRRRLQGSRDGEEAVLGRCDPAPQIRSQNQTRSVRFERSCRFFSSRPSDPPALATLAPRRSLADFVRSPEPTDRLRQRGRKRTSSSASESSRGGSRKRGRRGRNRRRRRRKSRRKNQRRSRRRRSSRSRSDR